MIATQAVLGTFATPPDEPLVSIEADLRPMRRPDLADKIDGAIGEGRLRARARTDVPRGACRRCNNSLQNEGLFYIDCLWTTAPNVQLLVQDTLLPTQRSRLIGIRETPPMRIASGLFAEMPHEHTPDAAPTFHGLIDQSIFRITVVMSKPSRPVNIGPAVFGR